MGRFRLTAQLRNQMKLKTRVAVPIRPSRHRTMTCLTKFMAVGYGSGVIQLAHRHHHHHAHSASAGVSG